MRRPRTRPWARRQAARARRLLRRSRASAPAAGRAMPDPTAAARGSARRSGSRRRQVRRETFSWGAVYSHRVRWPERAILPPRPKMTGSGDASASHACYIRCMTNTTLTAPTATRQATALAERLEQGARALITFARGLSAGEWTARMPHDGRTIGVIVHHVASVYPLEIQLAQAVGQGHAVTGVTMADVDEMNAKHAVENAS